MTTTRVRALFQAVVLLALFSLFVRADEVRIWAWSNKKNERQFNSTMGRVGRIVDQVFVELHPDFAITTIQPGDDFPDDEPLRLAAAAADGGDHEGGLARQRRRRAKRASSGTVRARENDPPRWRRRQETSSLGSNHAARQDEAMLDSRGSLPVNERPTGVIHDPAMLDSVSESDNLTENRRRNLQVKACPNCKKRRNWRICRALNCKCTCSGRRRYLFEDGLPLEEQLFLVRKSQQKANRKIAKYVKRQIQKGKLPQGYEVQVDIARLLDDEDPL